MRIGIPRLIAIFSSTLYVFLFPVWQYAEIPEVFALHNLLVITITLLIFGYSKKQYFLSLSHSLLNGSKRKSSPYFYFVYSGWLYLLKSKWHTFLRRQFTKNVLVFVVVSFTLGTSFYVYSIIASSYIPPLDWENAKTLAGFIRLITRSSYGVFKAYDASSGNITNQIFDSFSFFIFALHDFRVIGLFFAIIGIFRLKKNDKQMFVFFVTTMLLHLFFFLYQLQPLWLLYHCYV